MLRIELAELGLPALDALDVDAVAVFVGPERPLQGLAGFVDWRLCGALSRAIRAGEWDPASGEALLLPSSGRLGAPRIFCFGLPSAPLHGGALEAAVARLTGALDRAGSSAFAAALPPHRPEHADDAARAWLSASLAREARPRQVLLGDPRALQAALARAREALGAAVEIVVPVLRVELPARAAGLPGSSAVLR